MPQYNTQQLVTTETKRVRRKRRLIRRDGTRRTDDKKDESELKQETPQSDSFCYQSLLPAVLYNIYSGSFSLDFFFFLNVFDRIKRLTVTWPDAALPAGCFRAQISEHHTAIVVCWTLCALSAASPAVDKAGKHRWSCYFRLHTHIHSGTKCCRCCPLEQNHHWAQRRSRETHPVWMLERDRDEEAEPPGERKGSEDVTRSRR